MARGAHAAPKTPSTAAKAARRALVRSAAFTTVVAASWTAVSTIAAQDYLDAFAAGTGTGTGASIEAGKPPMDMSLSETQVRQVDALNRKYDCSATGLAPGVLPVRTVVRVGGEIRLATFDEGWAVHLGEVPGTLVSVCAR